MKHDKEIIRSVRKLAAKECCNWDGGICRPYDCPCWVINPAYSTVHDGCVDCDWFIQAVLPLQPVDDLFFRALNPTRAICYSNTDFVTASPYNDCVFDMELAYICALGFTHVSAIKYVSDNLSLHTYREVTNSTL